jgi:hypothetical protein
VLFNLEQAVPGIWRRGSASRPCSPETACSLG